jgi:hypothetical protein
MNPGPNKEVVVRGNELHMDMMVAGVRECFPASGTVNYDGASYTREELLEIIEAARQKYKLVREARVQLAALLLDRDKSEPEATKIIMNMRLTAQVVLGRTNPDLEKLGFKVEKKPAPLTVEQKALRNARIQATRLARHTMGSRQREAVNRTGSEAPPVTGSSSG